MNSLKISRYLICTTLLIIFGFLAKAAPMNGTYKIGGPGKNYKDFTAAVTALKTNGVNGPVTFIVQDSTYSEKVWIQAITGASTVNTITFQGKSGDSSKCILSYPSSASSLNNYGIYFDGADHITMKNISFQRTLGSSYAIVVLINNGCDSLSFIGCEFRGRKNSTTSSQNLVFNGSSVDGRETWQGNYFFGGYEGLTLAGGSTGEVNNKIIDNVFDSCYDYSIYTSNQTGLIISGNIVRNSVQGMYIVNTDGMMLKNNKIHMSRAGGVGLDIRYTSGSPTNYSYVVNNFISVEKNAKLNMEALSLTVVQYLYVLHNNIYIEADNNKAPVGVFLNGCQYSTSVFANNNIVNNANNGFIVKRYSTNKIKCDYNNYYSSTNRIYNINDTLYSSLAAFRSKIKDDSNSISTDPTYKSLMDLHTKSINIKGKAKPYAFVTTDIDGDARSTTAPFIGADEFVSKTTDLSAMDIGPYPYICGSEPIQFRLRNNGTDSVTKAKIHVMVNNGAVNTFSYTFSPAILSGKDTLITISGYTYPTYGTMNSKVWTESPNGGSDDDATDDTTFKTSVGLLSGTYTIGGSAPDFNDFTQAASVLRKVGICGPITMSVRNGTYIEQFRLGNIRGAGAANPILFTSEKGDSTKVILEYPSNTGGADYVVGFDTAIYVTFSKMTIRRTGTSSYANVLSDLGSCKYNTITNCLIKGCKASSSGSCFIGLYSADSNWTIQNNTILYGGYGIRTYQSSGPRSYRMKIINNYIDSFYWLGITLTQANNITISGNNVIARNLYSATTAITVNASNYGLIEKNKIIDYNTGDALYLSSCNGSSGAEFMVRNNFVAQVNASATNASAVYANSTQYTAFYFNNFLCRNNGSTSQALLLNGPVGNKILNNNIVNTSSGMAIFASPISAGRISLCDYNNIYCNGTKLASWGGSPYNNLAALQAGSGFDANSVSTNPLYTSTTDLHTGSSQINNKGTNISGITTDIDGDSRNATTPDIGADEMTPKSLDAELITIVDPVTWVCSGDDITVKIQNVGTTSLTSITLNVKSQYGTTVSKTFSWSNPLAYLKDTNLVIPSYDFKKYGLSYIGVSCTLPNGSADNDKTNDSFVTSVKVRMAGTYYIGGKNKDFSSFTNALSELHLYGLCKPVIFIVKDSTFTEQLYLLNNVGASAINTITFQGILNDSTKTRLRYPSSASAPSNYTLLFGGGQYYIFRKMSIERYNSNTYANVVALNFGSHHNTLESCRILGLKGATATTQSLVFEDLTNVDSNFTIKNCYFRYGYHGIYGQGTSTANLEQNNAFINNVFDSSANYPIYLQYQSNLKLIGNYIYNNTQGIYLRYCNNKMVLAGNKINITNGTYGMYISNCNGSTTTPQLIINNFISLDGTNTTNANGLYSFTNTYQNIYNNNFLIYKSTNSNSACIAFNSAGSTQLFNNNLINDGTKGYSLYIPAFSSVFTSNYNNIYSNSGGNFIWWNLSNYASLSSYQSVSGRDANSVSANPNYFSKTDLHVNAKAINNKAKSLADVPDDFDGELRNPLGPDIGADEMAPSFNNDAAVPGVEVAGLVSGGNVCKGTSVAVSVILKNTGLTILTSAQIKYTLNDTIIGTYNYSGSLLTGKSDTFKVSNIIINTVGSNRIRAYSVLVNGTTDSLPINDTSAYFTIIAKTPPLANTGSPQTICKGLSVNIGSAAVSGNTYSWTSLPSGYTSTIANPNVTPTGTTSYILVEKAGNCAKTDTVIITVNPLPAANGGADKPICTGGSTTIGDVAVSGNTYSWTSKPTGFTSTLSKPTINPTVTTTYYLTEKVTATACTNSDSVVITVNPLPAAKTGGNKTICQGKNLTIGATAVSGNTYAWTSKSAGFTSTSSNPSVSPTLSTSYYLVEKTSAGCTKTDSALIKVIPTSGSTISASICSGKSYLFNKINYTTSGTYYDTFANYLGCDSIITLKLNVKPVSAKTINAAICKGSTYSFGGNSLGTAGTYYDTLTNYLGCDSILTLNLKVNLPTSATINAAICKGSTYYFNKTNLSIAGTYYDTIPNANGCDSVMTLNLKVNLPSSSTISASFCKGSTYLFGGNKLSAAGTYYDTIPNAKGCDSVITLNLKLNLPSTATIAKTICAGDFYTFGGNKLTKQGTYYDTVANKAGCDSVITLNLKVNPTSSSKISAAICSGKSYIFGGNKLTTGGVYYDTLKNYQGCDSVITLSLKVNPNSSATINASICKGSSYLFNKTNLTTAGTYYDTIANYFGCDSIITLNLKIKQPSSATISASICKGNTYTFGGNKLSIGGTYYDTIPNAVGCDSIITLNLKVKLPTSSTINASICKGATYTFGGNKLTTGGTYYDTVLNAAGCDSVITLNLGVKTPTSSSIAASICQGAVFAFGGNNLNKQGVYYDTVVNSVGCDSIITLTLTVNSLPVADAGADRTICEGSNTELGNTGSSNNKYQWFTSKGVSFSSTAKPVVGPTTNSIYALQVSDNTTKCQNRDSVTVNVTSRPAKPVITAIGTDSLTSSVTAMQYAWYKNSIFLSQNTKTIKHSGIGAYVVLAMNDSCTSDTSIAYVLTGLESFGTSNATIRLYPNPTKGIFQVEGLNLPGKEIQLMVFDMTGKVLIDKTFISGLSSLKEMIDLSGYNKGIYQVQIRNKDIIVRKNIMLE